MKKYICCSCRTMRVRKMNKKFKKILEQIINNLKDNNENLRIN